MRFVILKRDQLESLLYIIAKTCGLRIDGIIKRIESLGSIWLTSDTAWVRCCGGSSAPTYRYCRCSEKSK